MSLPAGLSKQGERVWNFLQKAVKLGQSKAQTLRDLRSHGLSYRNQTFRQDMDIALNAEERGNTMQFVRREFTISDRHYIEAKYPLAGGFRQTTFQVVAFDTDLDKEVIRHITIAHDNLSTRIQLEALAEAVAQGTSPTLQVEAIKPVKGLKYPQSHVA